MSCPRTRGRPRSKTEIKTPRFPRGVFAWSKTDAFLKTEPRSGGGFLGFDRGRRCGRSRDRDGTGLLGLRDFADQVDVKQAVLEAGILYQHEIGKLERALEGARRDAAIQHLGLVLAVFIGGLLALDGQRILFRDDRELVLREAGDSDADAVGVVAGALDVVGRVAGAAVSG